MNVDTSKAITTISFFKGYGGLERGIELAGERIKPIASCEIEAYAISNLIAKMEEGALDPHPIWTNAKTFPDPEAFERFMIYKDASLCYHFDRKEFEEVD